MLWWFLSYVDILILNNLPSYGVTISVYPFITWWTFDFFLPAMMSMQLCTFMHMFLSERMFSLRSGIYIGVELLGHMVVLCLTFWGTNKVICTVVVPCYTCNVWGSQCSCIVTSLRYDFFTIAILIAVKWFLVGVLICIFSWLTMLCIFSCACGHLHTFFED